MSFTKAILTKKEMLTDDIGILHLNPKEKKDYKPGQFFNLKINNDKKLMRPYSIVSTSKKEYEFYIKTDPNGNVAKHILDRNEGEEIEINGPYGNFVLREGAKEIYFVSAGSGIAPLMCMARFLKGKKIKQKFLHCARYEEELGYYKELTKMENKNFQYIPAVTQPSDEWNGKKGRVTEHLDEFQNTKAHVYICGPPPMVADVHDILLSKGFKKENIISEKYY